MAVKSVLLVTIIVATLTVVVSSGTIAAPVTWLGAFGHVPTAENTSPPTTATDRDGVSRTVRAGYAPLPSYPAETTVREVVRISASASSVRIRLSNEFSKSSLLIGEAHVALVLEGGEIVPGSDHILTFAGKSSVVIPAGAPLLSDAVEWAIPALTKLAVTIYYPNETVPPAHTLYALNAWSAPGNQARENILEGPIAARSGNHLSQVDIVPQQGSSAVVCFGDSITEGVGSTIGAFRGWPDRLAERLQANSSTRSWSVVNAGLGSNRLLHDTPSTNALSRFDRDVLGVPGVAKVILLLGINDIQYSRRNPAEAVSSDDIIAAISQLIARAHSRNVDVIGGTITAFEGSASYSPDGEAMRTKVNEWIRNSGVFDGVIDFDRAIRDPLHPAQLLATSDSGGHLHPNDVGYSMLGDAIDLKLFAH